MRTGIPGLLGVLNCNILLREDLNSSSTRSRQLDVKLVLFFQAELGWSSTQLGSSSGWPTHVRALGTGGLAAANHKKKTK